MGQKHQEPFSLCSCCGRNAPLTFHHLIPRKLHRRAAFKKHYSREELNSGINICRTCHNGIHRFYDEMYLAKHLNSLEKLLADPALILHFNWVAKQKIAL